MDRGPRGFARLERRMKQTVQFAALGACLLFPSSLSSQAPLASAPPALSIVEEESAELEAALAAIKPHEIRSDLAFIASDELAGRDTPSPGLRVAARFLRARLQRLGFQAGGRDGDYFHYYKLVRSGLDQDNTFLSMSHAGGEEKLTFGQGYYFWPNGVGELEAYGDLVYASYGEASEMDGVDLSGKWAFCWDSEMTPQERERAVKATGAVGIVVASSFEEDDAHNQQRARGIARWAGGNRMRVVTEADSSLYPQVFVSREVAETLCGSLNAAPEIGEDMEVELRDLRTLGDTVEEHTLENVCGFWPGSDPELAKEVLIVSAHYDHVGLNGGEEIHNGADDNGSGTVGLLSIAGALAAHGPMKRSVMLIWVSGEEKGLLGSQAWTLDPTLPEGTEAVANLNIDMIGRNKADYLLITPTSAHPAYNGLTRMAEKSAPLEGFGPLGSADAYWARSDHANFSQNLGIPVAFLFSDVHPDYHQPTDTVEKIDYDKISRVARVVVRMLDELQDMKMSELASE